MYFSGQSIKMFRTPREAMESGTNVTFSHCQILVKKLQTYACVCLSVCGLCVVLSYVVCSSGLNDSVMNSYGPAGICLYYSWARLMNWTQT